MAASGYLFLGAMLFVALLWFGLFRMDILSKSAAVTLEVLTLVLMIWLFPYFLSTRLTGGGRRL